MGRDDDPTTPRDNASITCSEASDNTEDERQSTLLLSSSPLVNDGDVARLKQRTKVGWLDLPNKDQLFILAMCRLSEPLSNVCLLPYIFFLVRSVLLPEQGSAETPDKSYENIAADVSTYSGLLVASFPLAQFVVSLPWGRLSDSHGRKFSIVIGLAISVMANAAFGFSRSFGALFFWRTLAGLANGNVGIMRTMTAEIVQEPRFLTKAFLLLPLVFNTGMVVSLAFGGLLADPVVNLPWLFGPDGALNWSGDSKGVPWLLRHPYALPALVNAGMLSFALLLAVFWLYETLPGKKIERDVGVLAGQAVGRYLRRIIPKRQSQAYMPLRFNEDSGPEQLQPHHQSRSSVELEEIKESVRETVSAVERQPPTHHAVADKRGTLRSILTWRTTGALVSFALLPLHNSAFMHIFPVYLSTPHDDVGSHGNFLAFTGGLGLRSATIGIWLSVFGTCGILLQLFIYPRMQTRLGTLGVFRVSLILFPLVYLLAPYLSLLPETGHFSILRWVGLGIIVWGQIMARTMAIPSTVILLTESVPDRRLLGTLHGAGNMLASLARAVGPAVGGAVYAFGVREGIVGAVWWFYLVIVALVAAGWCFAAQGVSEDESHET
ncbi:major facilitator superfamily domain-containing protein [Podospora didyma]|uniref:Major facilitator superfamily domain-containing protein n=1 Tax=Podospora didyma TaxID=330526 RepID=A0AAE0TWI2_9PEZI|nr:major facilitator superfamily domain-containing protein [Podospora didyma]